MSFNDTNRNGSMPSAIEESAEAVSAQEPIQAHESTVVNGRREPATTFATRADAKGTEGIDRQKLVLLGGGLAVAVLFFVFTAVVGRSPKKPATMKQSSQQAKQEVTKPIKGSVTPVMDTVRTPAPDNSSGQLRPGDIRRTRSLNDQARLKPVAAKSATVASLGSVPSFADTQQKWEDPAPYGGSTAAETPQAQQNSLKEPSIVFVRSVTQNPASFSSKVNSDGDGAATLELTPGTRIQAKLETQISSAVQAPVVAVVEYTYAVGDRIIVPAGARVYVLIEHRGSILSASDWIPEDSSITSLTAEQGLCVRYPIRMQEDLLPIRHITNEELVPALKQALGTADLDETLVATILERQLRMEGTYILHSKTASKNGGDFDFDTICVMPSDQFPKFVAGRIAYGQKFRQEKTKHQKAKSPWWNACPVAMKARGNRIGSITDLKTSCLAAGRPDLAYKLVEQLQNALDSLKHRVEIDESVVSEIRKEVAPAPWLRYKRERTVSDLPAHLEVADTDKVGRLYNLLRKELGFLPDETGNAFEEKMGIEDFRGLFSGEHVTREMFEECQLVNSIYGDIASRIVQREDEVKQQLKNAQAQWETAFPGRCCSSERYRVSTPRYTFARTAYPT